MLSSDLALTLSAVLDFPLSSDFALLLSVDFFLVLSADFLLLFLLSFVFLFEVLSDTLPDTLFVSSADVVSLVKSISAVSAISDAVLTD